MLNIQADACPFCGARSSVGTITYGAKSDEARLNGQRTFYRVNCERCGTQNGMHIGYKTPDAAVEAWNRRAAGNAGEVSRQQRPETQPRPSQEVTEAALSDALKRVEAEADRIDEYVKAHPNDTSIAWQDARSGLSAAMRLVIQVARRSPREGAAAELRDAFLAGVKECHDTWMEAGEVHSETRRDIKQAADEYAASRSLATGLPSQDGGTNG